MRNTQIGYDGPITQIGVRDFLRSLDIGTFRDLVLDFQNDLSEQTSFSLGYSPNFDIHNASSVISSEFAGILFRRSLIAAFVLWINGIPLPQDIVSTKNTELVRDKTGLNMPLSWQQFDIRIALSYQMIRLPQEQATAWMRQILTIANISLASLPDADREEWASIFFHLHIYLTKGPLPLKVRYAKIKAIQDWAANQGR